MQNLQNILGVQNNMSKDDAPNKQENLGSKAFKAGVWYTVSNVATKAILVLTTPIFTRMMSVNDYGIQQLLLHGIHYCRLFVL